MTLGQMMQLALRQLDEDPEDISEYDDLFRVYANEGCRIAMEDYAKPRDTRTKQTDERGFFPIDADMRRVVEIRHKREDGSIRRNMPFELTATGEEIATGLPKATFLVVCEIAYREMERDTDEPAVLPQSAHAAIADYICYRHLSNGNLAKQSRAQHYQRQFYQAMQRIRPQGMGSVKGFTNLYAATDIRYVR